ncbi:NUDIX domain-containing protein [Zoogloea sp.]|uniref:GDP-mannose mannosyl hydrolase n=1 Tax=Zoogloea sp. TaxID=49181 RepID=UPI00141577CF|nr:MAG: NUDIX domain-containing protein [Zoogloea sp.]
MESRERFVELVRALPLVSVDLVLVRDRREVLLGLRTNRPAQGSWFVPGGRILKDERRADALARVAARELGIADVHALQPGFLGPFEHFYPDCFAGDNGVSTHYVVLAHRIDVPAGFEIPGCDEQHEALRWWPIAEAQANDEVHRFTRDYLPLLSGSVGG